MKSGPVRLRGATLVAALGLGFALLGACSEGETGGEFTPDTTNEVPLPDGGKPGQDGIDAGPTDASPDAGPVCGNGKKEGNEACDDGNVTSNDGCSASCQLESAFEGDTCPGKAIPLTAQGTLLVGSVTGTTTGAYNQYASGCGGGSGRDVVYSITSNTSGRAKVTIDADFAAIVSARTDCGSSTSETACADIAAAAGGTKTIEVSVFAGTPVFVHVDGYGGATGTFTLNVELSTAQCGNGIAELPEACDDGNAVNGDGCSSTCTLETGGVLGQCPGQPFELTGAANAVRKISLAGNTLTSGADTQGASGAFFHDGMNVVYALRADVDGSVQANLLASYERANLQARSECGSNLYQLGTMDRMTPGEIQLDFPVKKDEWFYLIVDGDQSGSKMYGGPYQLDVEVTPAACGNGRLDGNEACDDGNLVGGDGCSATCTLEDLPGTRSCPGHTVPLTANGDGSRSGVVSSTTVGNPKNFPACNLAGNANDAVFAVTTDIDGLLAARVRGPFNTVLSVLSTCAADAGPTGTLACSDKARATLSPESFVIEGMGSGPKRVGVPVLAGQTYWVVVDSWSSDGVPAAGPFTLELDVTPPVCGNGVVEGGEGCDDGGTEDGDGCSATCQLEPVTSRSTCADAEVIQLDPVTHSASLARGTTNLLANGNLSTSTSTSTETACSSPGRNAFFVVTAPVSGVLRASAKSSAFDVVLGFRKPTCALATVPFSCANDTPLGGTEELATPVNAGEQVWIAVDSKGADDYGRFTLDVSVMPSGCGDGFFVPGPNEACDDGNLVDGDGCSSTCTLEPKAGVDTCPGTTLTLVGSGVNPRRGTITFATETLGADYSGACGGNAKEGVVRVVSPIGGLLRATARGMPGVTVYARTVCLDPSTEILKTSSSTCPSVVHETVTVPVSANEEIFLFVDGLDGATGVPTLEVSVSP